MMRKKSTKENQASSGLQKFLFRCAGANEDILAMDECKTDREKFASIGSMVLFISVLASISMGYALFMVFKDILLSSGLGALWGLWGVRNLDRQFLINIKKKHTKNWLGQAAESAKQTASLLPRIGLAVVVALVVSKPLEIKIFEDKLKAEIATINQREADKVKSKRLQNSPDLANLATRKTELKNELTSVKQQREIAYKAFVDEAEGRAGTRRFGKGPVAYQKEQEVYKLDRKIAQLETELRSINNQIEEVRNRIAAESDILKTKFDSLDGFLTQLKALEDMSKEDSVIRSINFFVILIFILLESSPILLKVFSKYSPYDAILESLEQKVITAAITDIKVTQEMENNRELLNAEFDIRKHGRMQTIEVEIAEINNRTKHDKELGDKARKIIENQFTQILDEIINDPTGKLTQVREKVIIQIAEQIERELLKYAQQIGITGKEMYDLLKKIRDEELENALRERVHHAKYQAKVEEVSQNVEDFSEKFATNGFTGEEAMKI